MIQPIIVCPERQRESVLRLVEYIRNLDGTRVRIIPVSVSEDAKFMASLPKTLDAVQKFACLQAHGLRLGATAMRGQPFIWLEPDSIPLAKGWASALDREYRKHGKPFLISSDVNPPYDLVGGIGVYPGDTDYLVPEVFTAHGFDLWLVNHLKPLVARSPIIQHCYGDYDAAGNAHSWRFPKDIGRLRPKAVIFHRDKHQDLIPDFPEPKRFYHTGDLGDIIAALPIIREAGGGDLVIGNHPDFLRPMEGVRFRSLAPLIEVQPYIRSVWFESAPKGITHDISVFRKLYYRNYRTLTESQAASLQLPFSLNPWLTAEPALETKGLVTIARSSRYHNPEFPWKRIVSELDDRCVFLGLPEEHAEFCREVGCKVPHLPTSNFLRMASLIAGSDLFIGNQSSPCWVAMGLGHPLIQETHKEIKDSIVERPNAIFADTEDISGAERIGICI